MKQRTRFMVVILCMALLTLTSCKKQGAADGSKPLSKQEEALLNYQLACDSIGNATELTVSVDYVCNRTVGGEVYSEKFTETATYHGLGTDAAAGSVKQQVAFGPYETQYAEFYQNGTAYCQISDSTFRTNMDVQTFMDGHIPAVLVDPSLYGAVAVGEIFQNTVITFSEPTALESWATEYAGAVLQSASAKVTLEKDKGLTQSEYTAQYTCGKAVYDLQITVSVTQEAAKTLEEDLATLPTKCPALAYFGAPRRLLQVVGDVYTATAMSAEYTETVYSAAFARSRSQTSKFDIYGTGSEFMARSSYEVINTDYTNTPVTTSEVVIFRDDTCTSTLNGAEPTVREGITAETMRTFCEDAVLAALFTPNHLKNAKLTDGKQQIRIDFAGNTAFADNLCSSIYSIFNANLDTYAQSYTTPKASGYLYIDKATGLPTALGIALERVHVAGEVSYSLTYQLKQTMQLSSTTAYDNIISQVPQQETVPAEPATTP